MKIFCILFIALLFTLSSCSFHVKTDVDYIFDPQDSIKALERDS